MAKKKHLSDWTKWYAVHLVSATVETAAKQDVVMTFSPPTAVKRFQKSVASEFTLVGKTVDLLTLNRTNGTVTVHVTVAYGAGAGFNLTHNPIQKGDTVVTAVTNNIV